jgi:hypothetical protein
MRVAAAQRGWRKIVHLLNIDNNLKVKTNNIVVLCSALRTVPLWNKQRSTGKDGMFQPSFQMIYYYYYYYKHAGVVQFEFSKKIYLIC